MVMTTTTRWPPPAKSLLLQCAPSHRVAAHPPAHAWARHPTPHALPPWKDAPPSISRRTRCRARQTLCTTRRTWLPWGLRDSQGKPDCSPSTRAAPRPDCTPRRCGQGLHLKVGGRGRLQHRGTRWRTGRLQHRGSRWRRQLGGGNDTHGEPRRGGTGGGGNGGRRQWRLGSKRWRPRAKL
jgi:hypothetical protein